MKKSQSTSVFVVVTLLLVLACSSVSVIFAKASKSTKTTKWERMIANFDHSLNSEIRGVRMSTVEFVGRYKISNFESKLIEMLNEEDVIEDKQLIALSLFQLGTINSIEGIKKSAVESNNKEYKEFCSKLLKKFWEYDKLRSDYFEDLVVYTSELN